MSTSSNTLTQPRAGERQVLTARLTGSVSLSEATKHLEFEVEGVEQFNFVPGPFVSVKQRKPDGKEHTRAYSIASTSHGDNRFDLCLNRVDEGFLSNWLCDLEVGTTLEFHGPHGLFTLREPRRDSVFIATGTGVAPIRGMVHGLFGKPEHHEDHEFWLVFGTRYEENLYYREEFQRIAREYDNFHYVPTLSRCGELWTGCKGYVQDHVREIVGDRKDMQAYICGLHQMVDANRKLLKEELGWDRKQIVFERYD